MEESEVLTEETVRHAIDFLAQQTDAWAPIEYRLWVKGKLEGLMGLETEVT